MFIFETGSHCVMQLVSDLRYFSLWHPDAVITESTSMPDNFQIFSVDSNIHAKLTSLT